MNNGKIIKITSDKLIYFNYSENTIRTYIHYIKLFVNSFDKQYAHLNSDDFKCFLESFEYTSVSQQNQVINAIKFLYKKVLNKKYAKIDFTRPRKEKRLPRIIEHKYLTSCINKIDNLKHKAIISLAYATGMRVSEVLNLKISDIDSKRMIINVVQGKGRKDRIIPVKCDLLKLLRRYYIKYKPTKYIFNGQSNSVKYSSTSCNNIVKKHIGKKYHFHLLRHSCLTYLLENGTSLRHIQAIAGHMSSRTTELYTHISVDNLSKIQMPII